MRFDRPYQDDRRLSALMRAAQGGDRAAYALLLDDVAVLVRRLVRARRPYLQPEDVEDLVQDTLLSLHAARATYNPARPFLPWLMAIARHRMADAARGHARRAATEVAAQQMSETFSVVSANRDADALASRMTLEDAIEQLPSAQRKAIELVKARELSLNEAAAVSGVSVAALKVSIHRALRRLRRILLAES
jgi:RNA polymerase sigma factor (sigma-70 family)